MENMTVSAGVPEIVMGQTPSSEGAEPTFTGDMNADLALFAKTQQPEQPAQSGEPAQPPAPVTETVKTEAPKTEAAPVAQQAPASVPPVEIPDKFKTADGKLDEEKIIKSYVEAEKALKRSQNARPAAQPQTPETQAQPAQVGNLTPLELQVAQDLFNGGGYTEQQAVSQARVLVKLQEAQASYVRAATLGKVEHFEQTLQEQETRKEVDALKSNHPWVLTPKGQADIAQIRADYPHLNASQTPIRDAVIFLLGQRALHGQQGQVSIPNPTGAQQSVPPLPATPAPAASVPIRLDTPDQINAYVKTLTPAEEAVFWQKSGLRWDTPAHYKGI